RYTFDIAFVDIRLGAVNGIQLIPALLSQLPNLVIIMITAYASIESAVEAIHKGAYDYLPKPFTPVQIRHLIQKIGERRGLQRRIYELEEILSKTLPETFLITTSPVMQRALDIIQRAAT